MVPVGVGNGKRRSVCGRREWEETERVWCDGKYGHFIYESCTLPYFHVDEADLLLKRGAEVEQELVIREVSKMSLAETELDDEKVQERDKAIRIVYHTVSPFLTQFRFPIPPGWEAPSFQKAH